MIVTGAAEVPVEIIMKVGCERANLKRLNANGEILNYQLVKEQENKFLQLLLNALLFKIIALFCE